MTPLLRYNREHHQSSNNYGLFLFTLVLLVTSPLYSLLFPNHPTLILRISYTLVIIFGTYAVTNSLRKLSVGTLLGFFAMSSFWGQEILTISEVELQATHGIMGIVFFSFIGWELYFSIKDLRKINHNIVVGAIIGYLLIGIIGGQFCILLDLFIPGSFDPIAWDQSFYQYFYFSFISLTSVGFGDITPQTDAARSLALLISLVGQIYVTVIIALIIGKFLAEKP